jgi:hypothetical protein
MRIHLGFAVLTIEITASASSLVAALCMGGSVVVGGLAAWFC